MSKHVVIGVSFQQQQQQKCWTKHFYLSHLSRFETWKNHSCIKNNHNIKRRKLPAYVGSLLLFMQCFYQRSVSLFFFLLSGDKMYERKSLQYVFVWHKLKSKRHLNDRLRTGARKKNFDETKISLCFAVNDSWWWVN